MESPEEPKTRTESQSSKIIKAKTKENEEKSMKLNHKNVKSVLCNAKYIQKIYFAFIS